MNSTLRFFAALLSVFVVAACSEVTERKTPLFEDVEVAITEDGSIVPIAEAQKAPKGTYQTVNLSATYRRTDVSQGVITTTSHYVDIHMSHSSGKKSPWTETLGRGSLRPKEIKEKLAEFGYPPSTVVSNNEFRPVVLNREDAQKAPLIWLGLSKSALEKRIRDMLGIKTPDTQPEEEEEEKKTAQDLPGQQPQQPGLKQGIASGLGLPGSGAPSVPGAGGTGGGTVTPPPPPPTGGTIPITPP